MIVEVGTALSADWMRPLALVSYIARSEILVHDGVGIPDALRADGRLSGRGRVDQASDSMPISSFHGGSNALLATEVS